MRRKGDLKFGLYVRRRGGPSGPPDDRGYSVSKAGGARRSLKPRVGPSRGLLPEVGRSAAANVAGADRARNETRADAGRANAMTTFDVSAGWSTKIARPSSSSSAARDAPCEVQCECSIAAAWS